MKTIAKYCTIRYKYETEKKFLELLLTGRRTKFVEYMIYDTLLKNMVIPFTALLQTGYFLS